MHTHLQGLLGGCLASVHAGLVVLDGQVLVDAGVPLLHVHPVDDALCAAHLADVGVQLLQGQGGRVRGCRLGSSMLTMSHMRMHSWQRGAPALWRCNS